jgi:hypothetical protein
MEHTLARLEYIQYCKLLRIRPVLQADQSGTVLYASVWSGIRGVRAWRAEVYWMIRSNNEMGLV